MARNICPICGSENPEGSEFCEVCKANLTTLPRELYSSEPDPADVKSAPEVETDTGAEEELDLDRPVPVWLKTKLVPNQKKPMDFDTFSDMLFGVSDNRKASQPSKGPNSQKSRNLPPVYQPQLQNIIEPPLLEPDHRSPKTITEDVPSISDFLLQRPARKWEDRTPKVQGKTPLTDFSNNRPAKKWDDQTPSDKPASTGSNSTGSDAGSGQPPLWWQEDAPLVEPDSPAGTAKTHEYDDDPALMNCSSPTKLVNAAEFFKKNSIDEPAETDLPKNRDEFKPEKGSLLSDLMDEINSSSGSLTPTERQENQNGTVFYSGNHPADETDRPSAPDLTEITVNADEDAASAAVLDRILRNIGYEVEGDVKPVTPPAEEKPEEEKKAEPAAPAENEKPAEGHTASGKASKLLKPLHELFTPRDIENPLIPIEGEDSGDEPDDDPYGLAEEKIAEREDSEEEQEIPWDLFGTADMALPQSPEDPAYRTFSRSSIPDDPGSTTYQQRMISSILGKIIQAENYVRPEEVKNERAISLPARLFLALLAICGVVLILNTDLTARIIAPAVPSGSETADFYAQAEAASGEVLVVADYSPAYNDLMNNAVQSLLDTLKGSAEKVTLAVHNPAAVPNVHQLLSENEEIGFSGWWPSGVISIRSHLAAGEVPGQVWLLTSESTSVRYWAEQLAVSDGERKLHVMAPGQLEPLLKPYLRSGMISSMLSHDADLMHYGEEIHTADRVQMAVWYLTLLIPAAWLFGLAAKIMKTEPKYGRKSNVKNEETLQNMEKEPENG